MWLDEDLCPTDDLVKSEMESRIMSFFDEINVIMTAPDEKQQDYFSSKKINMMNKRKLN